MKKIIIIYFIGVIFSWIIGAYIVNGWCKEFNRDVTYGDVAHIAVTSIFSWVNVAAQVLFITTTLDIWDKPICNHLTKTAAEVQRHKGR